MMRRRTTSGFHSYLRAKPAATPAIHFPSRGRVSRRCANHARAPAMEESLGSASVCVMADMLLLFIGVPPHSQNASARPSVVPGVAPYGYHLGESPATGISRGVA